MASVGRGPGPCEWCAVAWGECDCYERAMCPKAGQPGHWTCGFCVVHDQPLDHCASECLGKRRAMRGETLTMTLKEAIPLQAFTGEDE